MLPRFQPRFHAPVQRVAPKETTGRLPKTCGPDPSPGPRQAGARGPEAGYHSQAGRGGSSQDLPPGGQR